MVRTKLQQVRRVSELFVFAAVFVVLVTLPGQASWGQDVTVTPEPPTLTPLPTETSSPNVTPTPTSTDTPSPTATWTETPTLTETTSPTGTDTATPTETITPTETESPTPTETATVVETLTPTDTEVPTLTVTDTTVTPESSPTASATATEIPVEPVVVLDETAESDAGLWNFGGTWSRCNAETAHSGAGLFSDSSGASYTADTVMTLSLIQPLSLPANTRIDLQYWQRLDLNSGDSGQVQVSTDNLNWITVASETAVRNLAWTVRPMRLDAYAGQSLWLRFVFSADSDPETVGDGWWLDDITVMTRPLPVTPLYGLSAEQSDDPTLWLSDGNWQTTIAPVYSGSTSWIAFPQAETAEALTLNTDVSLAGLDQPELHFAYLLDLAAGNDNAQVQVSLDGGQTWLTLAAYSAADNIGSWSEQEIDLAAYAGQTVRVRFLLVTDGDGVQGTGWTVDAISLQSASALPPTDTPTPTATPSVTPTATPSVVGWTTYQDTDPLLVYGGGVWQTYNVSGAAGGTLTGTADAGATLVAYFDGTGIRVIYSNGPEGGTFTAQVDGDPAQTADGYAESYGYGYTVTFVENLASGQHTLVVTNGSGAIWVEAVEVQGMLIAAPVMTPTPSAVPTLTPTPDTSWTIYQDADSMLVYNGAWETFEISEAMGGTLTSTTEPGATLTAYFEGTGIRVVYAKGPAGSIFTGQVDDTFSQTADGSDGTYTYGHVLALEGLTEGTHTLTVTNGTGAIWIEAVQVQGHLIYPQTTEAEPTFSAILGDGFEVEDLPQRSIEGIATFVPLEKGSALQITNNQQGVPKVRYLVGDLYNAALEMRFQIEYGQIQATLRQSTAGDYSVTVGQDGVVSLYRSGVPMDQAVVAAFSSHEWHRLHFSTVDNVVRLTVDDQEVIAISDLVPLPEGQVLFSGDEAQPVHALIDDLAILVPQESAVQLLIAEAQTALGNGAIRTDFYTSPPVTLPENDDDNADLTDIGFDISFFGRTYNQLYISNNGYVIFDMPLPRPENYTPFNLEETDHTIIAPFFADVDTRDGVDNSTQTSNIIQYGRGSLDGHKVFAVTWIGVGCYHYGQIGLFGENSFQVILIDRSDIKPGDFDIEFNYDGIQWETGTANGGSPSCLGGTAPARVGYSNGTHAPETFYEMEGSGVAGYFWTPMQALVLSTIKVKTALNWVVTYTRLEISLTSLIFAFGKERHTRN